MLRIFRGELQHSAKRCAVFQRPLAGALDNGSVGHRITERHSEFDHARAGFDRGEHDVSRGREIGIAAGDVGDQRGRF